jgi:hypothetical protein
MVVAAERVEWWDTAAHSVNVFREGLDELGVPKDQIERDLAEYESVAASVRGRSSIADNPSFRGWWGRDPDAWSEMHDEGRQEEIALTGWVRDWLRRPEIRTLETLFVLASPPVRGSCLTYSESASDSSSSGWHITVFGSGTGADVTVRLTSRWKFVARDGICKRVVLPATLAVSRLGIFRDGTQVREAERTELDKVDESPVVEVMKHDELPEHDPRGEVITYELAGDTSGDIATYELEHEFKEEFDVELGLDAFKIKAGIRAAVRQERTAKLTFDLPSGVDYCFHYLSRPNGVWCQAPEA